MARFFFAVLALIPIAVSEADAYGSLYGKPRLIFGGGIFRPGEGTLRNISSSGTVYGAEFGLPVYDGLEIRGMFSRGEINQGPLSLYRVHLIFSEVGLRYFMRGDGWVRLSGLGGAILKRYRMTFDEEAPFPFSQVRTNYGWNAGAEMALIPSRRSLVHVQGKYHHITGSSGINGPSEFRMRGEVVVWPGLSAFLPIAIEYGFGKGEVAITAHLGFAF